jgi:hypothetical protein
MLADVLRMSSGPLTRFRKSRRLLLANIEETNIVFQRAVTLEQFADIFEAVEKFKS